MNQLDYDLGLVLFYKHMLWQASSFQFQAKAQLSRARLGEWEPQPHTSFQASP